MPESFRSIVAVSLRKSSRRKWLDEDRAGLRLHRHLTETAEEWKLLASQPLPDATQCQKALDQ